MAEQPEFVIPEGFTLGRHAIALRQAKQDSAAFMPGLQPVWFPQIESVEEKIQFQNDKMKK